MNNLVRGFKTLIQKIEAAKRPQTKQRYQEELRRKMEANLKRVWNDDLLLQERRAERRVVNLQKQLNAALKRQRRFEKVKKAMDNKFKKLKEQQTLSARLLSDDERGLLKRRKYSQVLSSDELREINKKLSDDKKEQTRRRKNLKKQGKDIRDKRFEYLNDVLKKVKVEGPLRGTEGGQIYEFDLTLKGYGHSFTPEEYFEIMRQDVIDVYGQNNDSSRTKLIFKFVMAKYVPKSSIPVEYSDDHLASSKWICLGGRI